MHDDPIKNIIEGEQFEAIAYSQFHVAKAILDNPQAKVISESLSQNYISADINKYFLKESSEAKELFREGLPVDFASLSNKQKFFLVKNGGDLTLFFLGILSEIYQSIDQELGFGLYTLFAGGIQKPELLFSSRERAAIQKIKQVAEKLEMEQVEILLVYGAAHDFENIIKSLKDDSIIFNKNIETTYSLPDFTDIRMYQLIDLLNLALGEEIANEYGKKWFSTKSDITKSSQIKGFIYSNKRELEEVYARIKNQLEKSYFKSNYFLSYELIDENYDEWCLRLLINDADTLLNTIMATQINVLEGKFENISIKLRQAVNNTQLKEYLSNNTISYNEVIEIHKDRNLRESLQPMDYRAIVRLHPNYFNVLLKCPSIIEMIIRDSKGLSELVEINEQIPLAIINTEEYKCLLMDTYNKDFVIKASCKYFEFAKTIISDLSEYR